MIDLLLGWHLVRTPDWAFYTDYGSSLHDTELWDGAAGVVTDIGIYRVKRMELLVGAGVGLGTAAYAVGDTKYHLATWTFEPELVARWHAGPAKARASWEFGLGPHARVGLPETAPGRLDVGAGAHTALGVEMGEGPVRPMFQARFAFTFAPGAYSYGTLVTPDADITWRYYANEAHLVLAVGAAFGATAP